MIIWGGQDSNNYWMTGGRYNPITNSWTSTNTTSAPDSRANHGAVWTGSEMIVWGGAVPTAFQFDTGGRYNPATDSWTATSTTNAPDARDRPTAVWTGSEMIVWGGGFFDGTALRTLNTGGKYNPTTNSWAATSITNAPIARVGHHSSLDRQSNDCLGWPKWWEDVFNSGGRYDPGTDSWAATSTVNAPLGRSTFTVVWTGREMIVWGGFGGQNFNTGGKYCAQSSGPTPTPTSTPVSTPTPTATPTSTATPHFDSHRHSKSDTYSDAHTYSIPTPGVEYLHPVAGGYREQRVDRRVYRCRHGA